MRQSNISKSLVVAVAFAVSASAINAPIYGRCGGDGYEAVCPKGYKCQPVTSHYSQCVPIGTKPPHAHRELNERNDEGFTHFDKRSQTVAIPSVFDGVIGPDSCTGCVHRRNIQVLQTSYPTVFNMFLLALQSLQQVPESTDTSYYQIAGIHGRPHIKWQQVIPPEQFNPNRGYCTHNARLFNTWHRPYLSLFEQHLYRRAKFIASQFSGQAYATYSAAAEQVRLPYWDWAHRSYGTCLPAALMQSTISVTRPGTNGVAQTVTIANPLFQYNFQNSSYLASYFQSYFSQWAYTRRRPSSTAPTAVSNNAAACAAVNPPTTRRSQVYAALGALVNYNSFNSQLESIHNAIHSLVGGIGHMSTIDYAAFDPIFWLHHCNVDRIFAMYQATHSGNFLTPGPAVATYGRVVPGVDGPQDNLNTNLYPFRKASGLYYTSDDVKLVSSIWTLKYGYDEVPCSYQTQSPAALNSYTRSRINALYGPTIVVGPFTPIRDVFVRDDFVIRSVIDASELPGTWTLHAFAGKPQVKPIDYETAENRIATYSSFGNPGERHNSTLYDNQLPISDALIEQKVEYTKDSIIKYLAENLYYTITTPGEAEGEVIEIPIDSLKTFKLGVYTVTGNYTDPEKETDIPPVYGTPTYIPECTRGRPGGIESEKDILYPVLLDGTQIDLSKYYD